MIILVGPDGTGKSTLTTDLQQSYIHYDQYTTYEQFLEPLVNQNAWDMVFDRNCFCEIVYHKLMKRPFRFTSKQWHNLVQLTLAYRPVIVLCTYHQPKETYPDDQYLPHEKLEECLQLYKDFFAKENIPYIEYDFANYHLNDPDAANTEEYNGFVDDLCLLYLRSCICRRTF